MKVPSGPGRMCHEKDRRTMKLLVLRFAMNQHCSINAHTHLLHLICIDIYSMIESASVFFAS